MVSHFLFPACAQAPVYLSSVARLFTVLYSNPSARASAVELILSWFGGEFEHKLTAIEMADYLVSHTHSSTGLEGMFGWILHDLSTETRWPVLLAESRLTAVIVAQGLTLGFFETVWGFGLLDIRTIFGKMGSGPPSTVRELLSAFGGIAKFLGRARWSAEICQLLTQSLFVGDVLLRDSMAELHSVGSFVKSVCRAAHGGVPLENSLIEALEMAVRCSFTPAAILADLATADALLKAWVVLENCELNDFLTGFFLDESDTQEAIVVLLANDSSHSIFEKVGWLLSLLYEESCIMLVDALSATENIGVACVIEICGSVVGSHRRALDQARFDLPDARLLAAVEELCGARAPVPTAPGIAVVDARLGAFELAICHFYREFVAVHPATTSSPILLRVVAALRCENIALPVLIELLDCFEAGEVISNDPNLAAELMNLAFPFTEERPTNHYADNFLRRIARVLNLWGFTDGLAPMLESALVRRSIYRAAKAALEIAPSRELFEFVTFRVIQLLSPKHAVEIVRILAVSSGFPFMSREAVDHIAGLVRTLGEIVALPNPVFGFFSTPILIG
jgi:hypothetical protein